MAQTTRFLVISDTHDRWPYTEIPPPSVDVLLHCGDLTQVGGLPSFKRALENVKAVDAELKLIISGNHDLELDANWVRRTAEEDGGIVEDELEESMRCIEYVKSLEAYGIYYLEEGKHEFTLSSGYAFSIYASPYTPEFNDYAFGYGRTEDRFSYGPNPIPAGVDIVMTHGPPLINSDGYRLDIGKDGKQLGCEKLAKALQRVKPRLHCFGHIHEGRGCAKINWDPCSGGAKVEEVTATESIIVGKGKSQTVLMNAARNEEGDEGYLVDIDLSY